MLTHIEMMRGEIENDSISFIHSLALFRAAIDAGTANQQTSATRSAPPK